MNLKTLLLFFACLFVQQAYAAVDIKTDDQVELTKDSDLKHQLAQKNQFKKRRFRLKYIFQWKKWKKIKTEVQNNRKTDFFAAMAGTFGGLAFGFFMFTNAAAWIPIFLFFGGVTGIIGLTRIRNRPDELKGELSAWIGIIGMLLLIIGLGLFFFFDNFGGF